MSVFVTLPSVQKSKFSLPINVLTWVLCHLVGGTPITRLRGITLGYSVNRTMCLLDEEVLR